MRLQIILDVLKNTLDSETFFHSLNLKRIVTDFLYFGGYEPDADIDPDLVREACLLHDIGKTLLSVQQYIITGEKLSPAQVHGRITLIHTAKGEEQLEKLFGKLGLEFSDTVFKVIRHHHDAWYKLEDNSSFHGAAERRLCNVISAFDIIESLMTLRRYRGFVYNIPEALDILQVSKMAYPDVLVEIRRYYATGETAAPGEQLRQSFSDGVLC